MKRYKQSEIDELAYILKQEVIKIKHYKNLIIINISMIIKKNKNRFTPILLFYKFIYFIFNSNFSI